MDWFFDCKHLMFAESNTSAVPSKLLEDVGSFFACCASGGGACAHSTALTACDGSVSPTELGACIYYPTCAHSFCR